MTQVLNTITGTIKCVSTLSADFDNDPLDIDSDLVAKFTQELNIGTLKNMRKVQGVITPNNGFQTLMDFDVSTESIKLILIFFSGPMGLYFTGQNSLAGTTTLLATIVSGLMIMRPANKNGYMLSNIRADTRKTEYADPTDIDQTVDVKYAIFTFEEA